MSAGFTPGPWHVDGFDEVLAGDPCLELMVIGQGDYIVAQMVPERDASLIAAAPDLYEALSEANNVLRGMADDEIEENLLPLIGAALAKARGEA